MKAGSIEGVRDAKDFFLPCQAETAEKPTEISLRKPTNNKSVYPSVRPGTRDGERAPKPGRSVQGYSSDIRFPDQVVV